MAETIMIDVRNGYSPLGMILCGCCCIEPESVKVKRQWAEKGYKLTSAVKSRTARGYITLVYTKD